MSRSRARDRGRGRPASIWTPAKLTGLYASWRADLGVTGSPVSEWLDQTGNGYTLSQATVNLRPAYSAADSVINNAASLTFDGHATEGDKLVAAAVADWKLLHNGTGCTVLTSFRTAASLPAVFGALWQTGNASTSGVTMLIYADGHLRLMCYDNGVAVTDQVTAAATIATSTKYVLSYSYQEGATTEVMLRLNSTQLIGVAGAQQANANPATPFTFGNDTTLSAPCAFTLHETVIVSRQLSAAEFTLTERYMGARIGLAL